MRSSWFSRAARAACAVTLLAATAVTTVAAKPGPERPGRRRAANLFAVTNAVLNVNRVFCGINNLGELCVDPTNSPVLGGGFWPKGTPNQYIFNSGLQLAGVIPPTAGGGEAVFPWAGDTVGAFFFDARGTQVQGDAVTLVYNSLDAVDVAEWPAAAYVNDTTLFHPVLKNRADSGALRQDGSGAAISQQDLWTRAWDGNPAFLSGRTHPMGILVEERGVAWNFPTGNEDIIYFLFTFYNITSSDCTVYDNLFPHVQDVARREALQQEICSVGQDFQNRNEAAFSGIAIPDNGYPIGSLFAAFSMDPDVGDAGANFSTAILPFNMGVAYKSDFLEPNWTFPPEIFGAPFVASPGFVGVKYLKSPVVAGEEVGLTMFSNTRNAATGFPDPVGVIQLYRYLSGTVSPAAGDNPCTAGVDPQTQHMCFLDQTAADTRFFQASGPFTLNPGEAQTIVVAYVHAAPLPAGWVVGDDNLPGIPASGSEIFDNPATAVRFVERAAGWVSQGDSNGNLSIDQNEVTTVSRSLLNKALVAQAVFNNRFLLPFAPEAPGFFLVPGDNQVTITWQPSETETVKPGGGDPFFAIASQPTVLDSLGNPTANPLYDPNFRQYDVEGYRIYRGRTSSQLELVAQFDYVGKTILDFTGNFAYTEDLHGPGRVGGPDGVIACAPELGVQDDCPVLFQTAPPFTTSQPHEISGEIIQVLAGGRVRLGDGNVLIVRSDTAVTGGGTGFPAPDNSGVGFAFVDHDVSNSFTYHYAVTAFDVNSLKSGPSSLESPRVTKTVTPRKLGANVTSTVLTQALLGENGVVLDPTATFPAMDAANGTFSGIIPPANDGAMSLVAGLELLPAGNIVLRIDSLSAGFTGGIGTPPNMYMTIVGGGDTVIKVLPVPQPAFSTTGNQPWDFGAAGEALVPIDSARARAFGIHFTKDTRLPVAFAAQSTPVYRTSGGVSTIVGRVLASNATRQTTRYLAHSRWWDASGAEPADPTITACPDSAHHAGDLTGVGRIWAPQAYRDILGTGTSPALNSPCGLTVNLLLRGYSYAQTAWYPGDFVVTWNADSSITVRDTTHRVTLPYAPNGGSGWGFFDIADFIAVGVDDADGDIADGSGTPSVNALTYHHIYGTQPTCSPEWWGFTLPFTGQTTTPTRCVVMARKTRLEPVDFNADGTDDGTGIGLMINGEVFIMEMSALPAAGTQWRLRAIMGDTRATCTPSVGPVMTDCSSYSFTPPPVRPSRAPGLTYQITVTQQYAVDSLAGGDLSQVHTVPDPYYVTNALEISPNTKILNFVNLPSRAIIRIYSVSGVLVQVLTHNNPGGGGEATWNLRNRNNQFVASGVYFYHVEAPDGQSKIGRFTVVNFAQ